MTEKNTQKIRMDRFLSKLKAEGKVRVTVTIPEKKREALRRFVAQLNREVGA